ncbi:MAG TPA: signal peptidase II [Bradyrhizobium sp.]|nr:signal peptidase II [Bradyrhizobium sp.]
MQGRTFSYKSHIKVVRFILWDNLPARLCRFHLIRIRRRKKQRARGNKLMLIEMAIAASVIAADQASKAFVLSRSWAVDSNAGFLSIRKVLTRRGAPMFALATRTLVVLWIASTAIAAVLLQAGMIAENVLGAAGIGAALGGAAGNLADRLRHGAVVDFIVIGRWPPFNLADAAIVMGAGLLVLSFAKT